MSTRTVSLVIVLALASCSNKSDSPATAPTPSAHASKDPVAARDLIAKGAVVLDVRTPDEFRDAHLPSATNVPINDFANHLADVDRLVGGDKTKPVVVYCGAGARAAKAKQALEAAGYQHVVNGGGLDDLR